MQPLDHKHYCVYFLWCCHEATGGPSLHEVHQRLLGQKPQWMDDELVILNYVNPFILCIYKLKQLSCRRMVPLLDMEPGDCRLLHMRPWNPYITVPCHLHGCDVVPDYQRTDNHQGKVSPDSSPAEAPIGGPPMGDMVFQEIRQGATVAAFMVCVPLISHMGKGLELLELWLSTLPMRSMSWHQCQWFCVGQQKLHCWPVNEGVALVPKWGLIYLICYNHLLICI